MEETKNRNLPLIAAFFVVGFLAGFLFKTYFPEDKIAGMLFSGNSSVDKKNEDAPLFDIGNFGIGNYIMAENQTAGPKVLIKEVFLADGGWAVVREEAEGVPGRILGARRLDAGKYESVEIELLRKTEGGQKYYVILHGDDGDKEFDFNMDFPIRNDAGEIIMKDFRTVLNTSE